MQKLLSIIELGGYQNFSQLYQQSGFEVTQVRSVRKALACLKKTTFNVVMAEFNFQSDFRDRTSSLESLLARLQTTPEIRVIIFFDKENDEHLNKIRSRFKIYATFCYPINENQLRLSLQ